MKTALGLLLISILLFGVSCDNHDGEITLIGKWKLIERLADPGNGSGTFQPVVSNKTLNLFSDNTFQCNEDMCFMSANATQPSSGTYSLNDNTITPNNCNSTGMPPSFTIHFTLYEDAGQLIVSYPCIEACAEKYVKVLND